MKYVVQWGYRSAVGVLIKGETVDIEPDLAAWYNRDSPGVLVEYKEPAKRGRPPKVKTAMTKVPAKDRQVNAE